MQLTYRGLPYTADASAVEPATNSMTGQYRGSTFKIGTPDITVPHVATSLRYRGLRLHPGSNELLLNSLR